MKKYIFLMLSLLMSCSELIDEPKNLVRKDKMSEVIAGFAMNDQLNNYVPGTNMENATRATLKEQKVNSKAFVESYKYYTATGDLEKILNDAQEIIINKDPNARVYIEKKLKEIKIPVPDK